MDGESFCKSRAVGMKNGGGMRLGIVMMKKRSFCFMWLGVFECGYEVDGRMSVFCVGLFVYS